MIDRSYLPFQAAREHYDRGMEKWMGFFLSEHTTSLSDDKNKVDMTSDLTKEEKLVLMGCSVTIDVRLLEVKKKIP